MVTHYEIDLKYETGTTGWQVVSSCGLVLRGANVTAISDQNSMNLNKVDCPDCRRKYALEFLAEVP